MTNGQRATMKSESLLTVDDLVELLQVPKSRIYRWSHEGRLPIVRISSRCIRFRRSDIERWLRKKASPVSLPVKQAEENEA